MNIFAALEALIEGSIFNSELKAPPRDGVMTEMVLVYRVECNQIICQRHILNM